MKKIYLSASLFVICICAVAQPTLTLNNSAPMPGDSYITHFCPWQSEGPSGANQSWDFSNLVIDSTKTIPFVDPGTTPSGASFPAADVAQEDPGNGFVYFDYASGSMEYIGAEAMGFLVEQSDPENVLKFSCTFGTTWNDTQAGTIPFGVRSGTTAGNADAYGTLELPWGTMNNVLRVHLAQDYVDTSFVIINYDFDTWWWFQEGIPFPLLMIQTQLITPSIGAPITNQWAQYADQSVVGIGEEMEIVGSMLAYPVPATNKATIEYTLSNSEEITLELFDMTGRMVTTEFLGNVQPGKHIHQLNVNDLQAGAYLIQLSSPNGKSVMRIAVQ